MITYILLCRAANTGKPDLTLHRFAELVATNLFERKNLNHINKPPERPSRSPYLRPDQLGFVYG